jgi:hypothetical protein
MPWSDEQRKDYLACRSVNKLHYEVTKFIEPYTETLTVLD